MVKGPVKGTSATASAAGRTPVVLAIRSDTSSATLVTSWSINSEGSMGFDNGDTFTASGSKCAAPGPGALAGGCLPLFCFLEAGGLAVEAESLAKRLADITAKRAKRQKLKLL